MVSTFDGLVQKCLREQRNVVKGNDACCRAGNPLHLSIFIGLLPKDYAAFDLAFLRFSVLSMDADKVFLAHGYARHISLDVEYPACACLFSRAIAHAASRSAQRLVIRWTRRPGTVSPANRDSDSPA